MTDQTSIAGLTREQSQAVRAWAERSYSAEVQDETMYHAARVLLAVLPSPTLADMTVEDRSACRWAQADVGQMGLRHVITVPDRGDGHAALLNPWGGVSYKTHDTITPRLDLPRMEWPSHDAGTAGTATYVEDDQ